MSKSFFNYIQPTIVRLSDEPDLPEHLRNHFLINLNVVGIPYFVDNYLLIENGCGGYMYMLTNDFHKIRLSDTGLEGVIDVPRAYIVISEEFVKSQDDFSTWILSSIADNSFFLSGTENFKPGRDYFVNTVLWKYLTENEHEGGEMSSDKVLPDYLDRNFEITRYWQHLTNEEALHQNFNYFALKNKLTDMGFTEDQLMELASTFCKIILDNTMISESDMLKPVNQTYKRVLQYFADYQSDCAVVSMQYILGTTAQSSSTVVSSCGCNGGASGNSDSSVVSCVDIYKDAMKEWLSVMLGDANFYKDWMWIDGTETATWYANAPMIEMLIRLLEAYLMSGFAGLNIEEKPIYGHSVCSSSAQSSIQSTIKKNVENYITLLNWVLNGCIDNNTNKIRVIGNQFGNALPDM